MLPHEEENNLCLLFQKTEKLMSDFFNARLTSSGMDIRSEHWMILSLLSVHPRLTQQEIANKLYRDKTFVTRAIDFLEQRHFVRRLACNTDRRNKYIKLSAEGKLFYQTHAPTIDSLVSSEINALLPPEKAQQLIELLSGFQQKMLQLVKTSNH